MDHLPFVLADAVSHWDAASIQEDFDEAGAVVVSEAIEGAAAAEPPPQEWRTAPYDVEPTELELIDLAGRLESRTDEREVRLLAWRVGNEPFRSSDADWIPYSSRGVERENLEDLTRLLSASPSDRVLEAEALRQLGRFSDCIERLRTTNDEESPGSSTIREWAERRLDRLSVLFAKK